MLFFVIFIVICSTCGVALYKLSAEIERYLVRTSESDGTTNLIKQVLKISFK